MKFSQIAISIAFSSLAVLSHAAPVWQDFSITGLYGENYAIPGYENNNKQSTVTFEYAAKLKYGDFFAFADRTHNDYEGSQTYFEVSPRLSLGEVSGHSLALGPIKDVLLAGTWEGGNDFNNYLYGFGFDLDIPYFQYAQLNFYRVNNELSDNDYQMTFVYGVPFQLSQEDFLFDGFLDWSSATSQHSNELNWTSQLKWNVGKHISPDTRLYVGVEYSHWNNKYGIPDLNQHDVSALIKYHF